MQRAFHVARRIFVLSALLLFPAFSRAAGLDFDVLFGVPVPIIQNADRVIITNRHFNTITGPADGQRLFTGTRLIQTGDSNSYLGLRWMQVTRFNAGTGMATAEWGNGLDINDWPMGLAYDPTNRSAVLVTLGGEGFLYRKPAITNWHYLNSMHNEDLDSLVFFPPQSSYWGLRVYTGSPTVPAALLRYDRNGQKTAEFNLPALPVNVGPAGYHSELVAVGERIVMLLEPNSLQGLAAADVSRIFVINPFTMTAELTYEALPPSPPQIWFTYPTNNFSLLTGFITEVRISYFDPDNDIGFITVKDGSSTLLERVLEPGPAGTNPLSIHFTSTIAGAHVLTARATDARGLISTSAPLTINVTSSAQPATLELIGPANNAEFRQGTNILLSARGFNGNFTLMSFYSNLGKIRDVTNFTATGPYQLYSTLWSNLPFGATTLRAVGRTGNNTLLTSAPVQIHVLSNVMAQFFAERDLATNYTAGQSFEVTINVRPNASTSAWAIEEQPPKGWAIGQVFNDGIYDPVTAKVKWGPFVFNSEILLSYRITAPSNAIAPVTFTGIASVNGVSQLITGDTNITRAPSPHPADVPPADFRLTVNEVTAYAGAWRNGDDWPRPPVEIPISYVTRAGYLWRAGEQYVFNSTFPAPDCWSPALSNITIFSAPVGESVSTRVLSPAFTRGHATTVTLRTRVRTNVRSYAIEERPPAGWTVVDPGTGSAVRGGIRFGPYFDSQERTNTYTVLPSTDATRGDFSGQVSFDGSNDRIVGGELINPPTPVAERVGPRHIRLRLNATPGEQFIVESADAIEAARWQTVATITGAEAPVELPDIEAADTRKFYRLRPAN